MVASPARTRRALIALYVVLALAPAGVLVGGLVAGQTLWALGGGLGFVLVVATAPVAFMLAALPAELPRQLSAGTRHGDALLEEIREYTMLSENAKRILFRQRELDLLRRGIEDDIRQGDYNAAIALCDEMANVFGYRQEAEAFRSRIVQARQEHYDAEVEAAREALERELERRNWTAIHQHAARIRRLYPDSYLVGELDGRIHQVRQEHKRQLEAQFLEAAASEDVEGAMELLRQLDRYLSREEAGRLSEVAEGVITRHRDNLGVSFKLAVNEHRWAEAARVGEMIIAEFPNSKMATEVRGLIEVLRGRAGEAEAAVPDHVR